MSKIAFFRPEDYAEDTIRMFRENGFDVLYAPFLKIKEFPDKIKEFEKLLESGSVDFSIFTSRTSARIALRYIDADKLRRINIIAIGPVTAGEFKKSGITPITPERYTSLDITREFKERLRGKNVAVVRSNRGDPSIYLLENVCNLKEFVVYTLIPERGEIQKKVLMKIIEGDLDVLVFSSSMMVESFFSYAEELGIEDQIKNRMKNTKVIAIGPPTMKKLKNYGINSLIPEKYTFRGIISLLHKMTLQ